MSEQGLTVGRDALARAMDLARKSSRAAKVAALLVPLAAIAAQQPAHASVVPPTYSGTIFSGSESFMTPGSTASGGSVSWNVSPCVEASDGCGWDYSIDFSVGASGITQVVIPVGSGELGDLDVTTNGGSVLGEIAISGSGDETILFDTEVEDGSYGINPFNITFNNPEGPVMATYAITVTDDAIFDVDPPIPGAVPEPGTLALFGMALLGFGALRRRLTG